MSLDKNATTRSRIPADIEEDNRLMVTDTFAASFGIRLESANFANLLYSDRIVSSIKAVQKLLSLDDQNEREIDSLLKNNFNEKAMEAYTNLLSKIYRYQTNLKSETLLPTSGINFERNVAKMDSIRSLKIIDLVDNKRELETVTKTIYGELYSVNNKTKKFEFQNEVNKDLENIFYKGDISDALLDVIFEVPSKGLATINIVKTINPYKHTEKEEYLLLSWEQDK